MCLLAVACRLGSIGPSTEGQGFLRATSNLNSGRQSHVKALAGGEVLCLCDDCAPVCFGEERPARLPDRTAPEGLTAHHPPS
jgi:hypothetical protein